MSFYKSGLNAGATWFPSVAEPIRDQAGEVIAGLSMLRSGGSRMYELGALQKQDPVAPGIDGVVGWLEDAGKGLLLLLGIFVTVSALSGGKRRE